MKKAPSPLRALKHSALITQCPLMLINFMLKTYAVPVPSQTRLLPFRALCHTLPGPAAITMSSVPTTDSRHRCKTSC